MYHILKLTKIVFLILAAAVCVTAATPVMASGPQDTDFAMSGHDAVDRPTRDRVPPPLPPEVARLARELESQPTGRDGAEGDIPQAPGTGNPDLPVNGLRIALDELRRMASASDPRTARSLTSALADLESARSTYAAGSDDLRHLPNMLHAIQRAQNHLRKAAKGSRTGSSAQIQALQANLSSIGMRVAGDLLRTAEAAGVSPSRLSAARRQFELGIKAARGGDHGGASAHQAASSKIAANTIVFDVDLFRQLVLDALEDETVGHAFSIAYKGVSYGGGDGVGEARTSADEPETDQSPNKESHVASVSKTITAIALLRLLDDVGISPYTPVAPYLPSDWALGTGVESLTFADFMKHESGFAQNGITTTSYNSLRVGIATDVGVTSWSYSNANYSLMRVLIPGILGFDPINYPAFLSPALMASVFITYVRSIYDPIGVEIDCRSNDDTPTIQYKFPYPGDSGYLEPNRWDACGGVGWFIDSNEIAATMAHLRNSENLIPTDVRATMEQDFLGYMDPANYGGSLGGAINGAFGVNYMHGGDWGHGGDELHACTAAFPIQLEAGIIINSEIGNAPYQCTLLNDAFEGAWVAK